MHLLISVGMLHTSQKKDLTVKIIAPNLTDQIDVYIGDKVVFLTGASRNCILWWSYWPEVLTPCKMGQWSFQNTLLVSMVLTMAGQLAMFFNVKVAFHGFPLYLHREPS